MAQTRPGKIKKLGKPAKRRTAARKVASKKTTASTFAARATTDALLETRFARLTNRYDIVLDQLEADLKQIAKAILKAEKTDREAPRELLRQRQSILTTMRTMMSGEQEFLLALMKSKKLLGNLGEEASGGDTIIQVVRLPVRPPDPVREDLPPDDPA